MFGVSFIRPSVSVISSRPLFPALLSFLFLFSFVKLQAQVPQATLTAAEEKALRAAAAPAEVKDTTIFNRVGKLNLHFSQVYLNNWAAGGQSNLSAITKLDQTFEYDRRRFGWDTEFHAAFGLLHRPDDAVFIKTDDRIEFATKVGYRLTANGFVTFMASFRSQLAPGYAMVDGLPDRGNLVSNFMSPGYSVMAAGMDYKEPEKKLTVFVAPVTYKATYVHDDSLSSIGAFGVEPGERSRHELGGYIKLGWNTKVVENVDYAVRFDLFSNYLIDPQNVDLFTDHTLTLKVNDYLSTTISATLIYDHDVTLLLEDAVLDDEGNILTPARNGPGLQLKEVLSVGFSLTFP